jgi:hypothetical protein
MSRYKIKTEACLYILLVLRRNERGEEMVELPSPYYSHSSHCKVTNTQWFPVQYAKIPLKLKVFTKFNCACEVHQITFNKLSSNVTAGRVRRRGHKLNVFKNSRSPQTQLHGAMCSPITEVHEQISYSEARLQTLQHFNRITMACSFGIMISNCYAVQ